MDDQSAYQPRVATRSSEDRILGGVAAGVALHLGLPVAWVRAAFLATTVLGGLGPVLYAALWVVLPTDARFTEARPGVAAATRSGRRRRSMLPGSVEDAGPLVALSVVGVGTVLLLQGVLGRGAVAVWPVLLAVAGLVLLWRQADDAQHERWRDTSTRIDPWRALVGRGGWASYLRLGAGVGLIAGALVLFAVMSGQVALVPELLAVSFLGVAGLALIALPWLFRLATDLSEEREARVRTQERADVAAHLHDSVLQTLALIQKHAEDGRTVARLARSQERDLRSWLYGDHATEPTTVAGALRAAAAEVEDAHGLPVELVTVGDATLSEGYVPVVLAAREAMVNAAKHSGADRVDVYAESSDCAVEVFVRDRGGGFDPELVAEDRMGLRNSIEDRMRRHGGSAVVKSIRGRGTEVQLSMSPGHAGKSAEEAPWPHRADDAVW